MKRKLVIFPFTIVLGLVYCTVLELSSALANTAAQKPTHTLLSKGRKPVFKTGIPSGGSAGTPTRAAPNTPRDTGSLPGRREAGNTGKPKVDPRLPKGSQAGQPKRGSCLQGPNPKPLMALLPLSEENYALTASVHPTFYVYVPPRTSTTPIANLKLKDEKGNTLFKAEISLGNQSGVMGFKVPFTAPPLLLDQYYLWEFTLVCEPGSPIQGLTADSASNLTVGAWVRRVRLDPVLALQLSRTTADTKASLYAEKGIWHDLLATMAAMRLEQPDNTELNENWVDLFNQESIALQAVANEPILPVQVLTDSSQTTLNLSF